MKVLDIIKSSAKLTWHNKALWVFGLFVAAAGGGGGGGGQGGGSAGGASVPIADGLPGWLIPALVGAALLGLAALVMHVVSEAALIDAVERTERGEGYRFGEQVRTGLRAFWRVLGVKLVFALTMAVSLIAMLAPALLAVFRVLPLAVGLGLTLLLALPGVVWVLTLYCWMQYTLRVSVLHHADLQTALREAWEHLHGRVSASLELLVAGLLGDVAMGIGGLVGLVVSAALGGLVYLAAGLVAALVVGGVVLLPVLIALLGAVGTYRSSVWTLGFLHVPASA